MIVCRMRTRLNAAAQFVCMGCAPNGNGAMPMSAIRAARGYTGRDKIIKFKGCYHGHSDGLLVQAGSAALTQSVPDSAGVPASFAQQTLVALFNDRDSVRELFENNKGQIAALIVEPVAANMGVVLPEEGFLQFLREITEESVQVLGAGCNMYKLRTSCMHFCSTLKPKGYDFMSY